MNDIWPYVTKQNPCGICGKPDWCQRGDRGWKCQRVQSHQPFKKGGWFHPFDSNAPVILQPKKSQFKIPTLNAIELLNEWRSETTESDLQELATDLGVSVESVASLGAVKAFWRNGLWSLTNFPARGWAFPMRDGNGNIIGIRIRSSETKQKWAVRGSLNGIFIPQMGTMVPKVAYLPEGPTSTAAALSMGLFAIGRPACHIGGPEIKIALKRLGIFKAVIVADNDDKPNGLRPGYEGAIKLAKEIDVKSVIWSPPTKDIRDFYRAGGTKELIESEIKNFVWRKY